MGVNFIFSGSAAEIVKETCFIISVVIFFVVLWNTVNYISEHWLFKWKFANLGQKEIRTIDEMSAKDFEILLEQMFSSYGYIVEKPIHRGLNEKHFIISKDGIKTAVRFYKFPTHKRVTKNAIYHVLTGKVYNGCHRTLLISTTRFTAEAEAEAAVYDVEIWDRGRLFREISQYFASLEHCKAKLAKF